MFSKLYSAVKGIFKQSLKSVGQFWGVFKMNHNSFTKGLIGPKYRNTLLQKVSNYTKDYFK